VKPGPTTERRSLSTREQPWIEFLNSRPIRHAAAMGVWKGGFAAAMLRHYPGIETYTLVDPQRPLESGSGRWGSGRWGRAVNR
jgi:hypothetical protein